MVEMVCIAILFAMTMFISCCCCVRVLTYCVCTAYAAHVSGAYMVFGYGLDLMVRVASH